MKITLYLLALVILFMSLVSGELIIATSWLAGWGTGAYHFSKDDEH